MSVTLPGTYVLYTSPGTERSPALAIVCPDDYAPRDVRERRPLSGYVYVSLVLLVDEPHQFQWARTSQLSLVPEGEGNADNLSSGQQQASRKASFWRAAGAGMKYWRDAVRDQDSSGVLPSTNSGPDMDFEPEAPNSDVEEQDPHMKMALQMSKEHYYGSSSGHLPTPSISPLGQNRRGTKYPNLIVIDNSDEDDDDNLYSWPSNQRSRSSPKRARPSRIRERDDLLSTMSREHGRSRYKPARSASPSSEIDKMDEEMPKKRTKPRYSGGASLDQLLGSSSLSRRAAAPVSDTIEGDISESREFIRLLVGPDAEVHTLMKKDVWDRPCFRDSRTGINYFHTNEDNVWELRHPQLSTITTADFQFVAEYLTDESFGIRLPDTPEETKEAIAQCVAAWEAAEKLGMDDMLDHIADKVKFFEWDNEDILILAIVIYRSEGPTLPAHTALREWTSSSLAHHFWTYIRDETVGPLFRKLLRKIPELERDVFMTRGELMKNGAELEEDEESDEGELGDNDAL